MNTSRENEVSGRASAVWVLALWSGLVMGLGEAALFLGLQALGKAMSVSVDIVWAALAFDLALCLVVGVVVVLIGRWVDGVVRRAPVIFVFLIYLNWSAILLNERIHPAALILVAGGLAVATVDAMERKRGRFVRMARSSVVAMIAVALASTLTVTLGRRVAEARAIGSLPPAGEAPNVLVLLIDTFRADHASAYGYHRETTPNLDALAARGVLWERAFATSSYTLASHASILTGLLPHEHGAEWDSAMDYRDCEECTTIGEVLQERGYATAGFSSNPYWFTREYGFDRGFHHFEDFFGTLGDVATRTTFGRAIERLVLPRLGYIEIPGRKSADFVNDRLLGWLDRVGDRPFFAFVNYFDIHDPYLPPEPYRSLYAGRPVGGQINWRITGIDPQLPDSVIEDELDAYNGAINYIDYEIGRLLQALAERGELDNTVVIVTSDHGEEFGEHGFVLHGHSLYAQSIHVPLIVAGPGVPEGRRERTPVSNRAIPSTLMALLFGERGFPEPSLLDWSRAPSAPRAELVQKPWGSERHPTFHGAMQSVVDDRWHFIRHEAFGVELYDLDEDLAESNDLADRPDQRERIDRLGELLDAGWSIRGGG